MRFLIIAITIIFVKYNYTLAEIYPRYNKAGYASKAAKYCIIMSDESLEGIKWTITDKSSTTIAEGNLDKNISRISAHTPKPFNYLIDFSKIKQPGNYDIKIDNEKTFTISIKNNPYGFLVPEMVSFLKKQRSGVPVPPDNEIGHSGDIKCRLYERVGISNDKWQPAQNERYVDMMGGWYDAGDYLKFTLTTAYTTYFLLRSYEEYPVHEKSKLEKEALLEEALWGMDYLLKTMPDENTFIIQVGNADDHKQGQRMPYRDQLNGQRHAYAAFSPTQMGLTAAALALGARLLSNLPNPKIKPQVYKDKAIQIYKKAIVASVKPAWFEEGWEKFYADQTDNDNMELAATELYMLTEEEKYLDDAKEYATKAGAGWWSSWANINMVAHLRLIKYAPEAVQSLLVQDLNNFSSIAKQEGNIWGIPHAYTWASLYSFLGVGSAAISYTSLQEENSSYEKMGIDVLHYTLGQNNWGTPMVITDKIPGSAKHIYSQMYSLYPSDLSPIGAIAEGPGDKKTHDELTQYFSIPKGNKFEEFNTKEVVFYDHDTDFQCMETTIAGMADGIYFFTLINKIYGKADK